MQLGLCVHAQQKKPIREFLCVHVCVLCTCVHFLCTQERLFQQCTNHTHLACFLLCSYMGKTSLTWAPLNSNKWQRVCVCVCVCTCVCVCVCVHGACVHACGCVHEEEAVETDARHGKPGSMGKARRAAFLRCSFCFPKVIS